MTEPVLGSYYTFKYIGGRVYDPDQYDGEGMYIGQRGGANVFATILPKRTAEVGKQIQSIMLTYTKLGYQPIQAPRDKVMMTDETRYLLTKYFASTEYKDPVDNGRIAPTTYILAETLIQQG
jgi:hypothetical protein